MGELRPTPNGVEVTFSESEILVSKTDPRGLITYANQEFILLSGYTEEELLGKPHAIVRHPDMPACVFQLLWDTLQSGRELFAYVQNLTKVGSHYWVFAHITPDIDPISGQITGYHSSRRKASSAAIAQITDLYSQLRQEERRHHSKAAGIQASKAILEGILSSSDQTYEEFVFQTFNNPTSDRRAA